MRFHSAPSDGSPITAPGKICLAAAVSAVGWAWAIALLATRLHLTANYDVLPMAPPFWGILCLPASSVLFVLGVGLVAAIACGRAVQNTGCFWTAPIRWLMCSWLIPGMDLLRLAGISIPMTFLEPLFLAGVTGAAVGAMADVFHDARQPRRRPRLAIPWTAVVWLAAILCCGWWYYEGQRAYDNYLLGYNDFAQYGWRVANTWEGRGFLMETPSLPAFWDHFNPGLALLAPLWGLWPDPRLFPLIQAICLAAPAPAIYGIVRRLGANSAVAAVWAAAYLTFPVVGQLNQNSSYGWHPVSLALPLILLAVWALLRSSWTMAFVAVILACSFQEDILVVLCCLAIALAFQAWLGRRRPLPAGSKSPRLPADALPAWAWLAVAAFLGLAFIAIFEISPFSKFQSSRFSDLGDSAGKILLSPVLRPAAFWGAILRPRCGLFLLCLTIPLGLRSLFRGWPLLLAAALPLGVLLAWSFPPATSIAFQYTTTLIPIFLLAAIVGSAGENAGNGDSAQPLRRGGMAALAACATASVAFGSMPWSGHTLTDVIAQTYGDDSSLVENRFAGSPGNEFLKHVVEAAGGRESSVLSTGRVASHLLAVRRLYTVGHARKRWKTFEEEIGPGRSPIELFDWVVLDRNEHFYQSEEEMQFMIDAAKLARYTPVESAHGILVFARPSMAASWRPFEVGLSR